MNAVSKFNMCIIWILLSSSTLLPLRIYAQITGRVTDADQKPISLVNIKVQGSGLGTLTNAQGEYAIDAYPGDVLLFSHVAMEPIKFRIKRNTFVINVQMTSNSIELEEVEISKQAYRHKSKEELLREYPHNKRLIKTMWGLEDTDRFSGSFRIVDGEDMVSVGSDFLCSLQSIIPHLRVDRDNPEKYPGGVGVFLRWGRPVFDVDGFVNRVAPTYLQARDIDRIAILERNSAIMRYGPQGANGVIVINTRAQTWMDNMGVGRSEEYKRLLDSAMRVTHLDPYSPQIPPYLEKLQKLKSEKRALAIVEAQQSSHLSDPYYFLELYELFLSRWGNTDKPKQLSYHILKVFSEDASLLRALAYIKQRHGYYLDALDLYTEILKSQSWHAQALRDVANAYAEMGENESAWWYYSQYIKILDQLPEASFDPYGVDQLIATEMMNILDQNDELLPDDDTIYLGINDGDPQTRLVFEWNNPGAEFELQFVTPEGYYDTWSNIPDQDASQESVSVNGYTSHQFFLGKENIGMWQINIDYRGNNSDMPTYLKVTVYRNYGLPGQENEIKIYKLSTDHERLQLFTLEQG